MSPRWTVAVLALLGLLALACEGSAGAGSGPSDPGRPRPGTPGSIAALGDSITTGFGSCVLLASCTRNSWSTGDGLRVESHYRRLQKTNPAIRGHAHNAAAPGARASALPAQAETAVRAKAEYVTILIGANDACRGTVDAMTGVDEFRRDLDRALKVLKQGLPKARVLVLSLPDLNRLWEVGHTESRVTRIWSRGICPALLANPTSTAEADRRRRAAFADRIDAYNRQLAAACRAYGSRCRYDNGAVHRVRFTLDLVNPLDYFHPNVAGQNRLAEVSWENSGY
ncbi:GDSL-type esterase/lipase family protein [Micromonospora sp. NPDC049559]|uniref:GDSL-type esterase/lipase family protein n=1 Tax=Micromonospora sp. NPDC049559 TaxID=3155923 RepID=UPI003441D2EE